MPVLSLRNFTEVDFPRVVSPVEPNPAMFGGVAEYIRHIYWGVAVVSFISFSFYWETSSSIGRSDVLSLNTMYIFVIGILPVLRVMLYRDTLALRLAIPILTFKGVCGTWPP